MQLERNGPANRIATLAQHTEPIATEAKRPYGASAHGLFHVPLAGYISGLRGDMQTGASFSAVTYQDDVALGS
jgi:hypothetical protein